MTSVAGGGVGDPIVLSDDESEVDCVLEDTDDEVQEIEADWKCHKCSATNSPYAADCTTCGEARQDGDVAMDTVPGPSNSKWDFVSTLEVYMRADQDSERPIVLESCSCSLERSVLKAHVAGLVVDMPADSDGLARHFNCPNGHCGAELARRDLITVLDDDSCTLMDEHIFHVLEGELQARGHSSSRVKKPRTDSLPVMTSAEVVTEAVMAAAGSSNAGVEAPGSKCKASLSAGKAGQQAHGKPRQSGLPKGTGYDGEYYGRGAAQSSKAQEDIRARAQAQEGAADQAMAAALTAVKSSLEAASLLAQSTGRMTAPPLVTAVVYGSPLAFVLRRLLQNDSLLDIGQRSQLYRATLDLLQFLGKRLEFVLLFHKPAADSADDEPNSAPSILDALVTLNMQCTIFKRSASELVSDEETRALSLALEIGSITDDLQKTTNLVRQARRQRLSRVPRSGIGEPSPEERDKWYCQVMSEFRLREWPLAVLQDFYFRGQMKSAGGFAGKDNKLRVNKEIASLATTVPLSFSSSVFLVVDDARFDMLRACIIGPEGTPYENGAFIFDIWLPPQYPNCPPKVQFLTTGAGRVRFNPNLYNDGKVCLSLLGTWDGPAWDPKNSTILQVLVSIQSMVFVEDPYFNEPGYAATAGSRSGQAHSEGYNRRVRSDTLTHALLPALAKPPAAFKDALQTHFRLKRTAVLKQLEQWEARDGSMPRIGAEIRELLKANAKPS